jgi:hypothetical protein
LEGSKGQGFHAATACNVTIAGSTISSNAGGGVTATGGTITITGSTINSNAGGGVSMSAANFTVVNNFFWDNGAGGSLFGALEITHAGMPNPKRVEFNTIVSNNAGSPQPAGVKCTLTSTAVAAKHNIVHDNDRDGSNSQIGAFGGPNGCTWTFSLVTDAGFSATGGNINGPVPTFVALGSGNLHLSPSSPSGINGGDTTGTDVTIDIDGQARANGVPDIGADEVHP